MFHFYYYDEGRKFVLQDQIFPDEMLHKAKKWECLCSFLHYHSFNNFWSRKSNFDFPSPFVCKGGSTVCVFANIVIVKIKCKTEFCWHISDSDSYSYTSSSFTSSDDYIKFQRRRNNGFVRLLLYVLTMVTTAVGEWACWQASEVLLCGTTCLKLPQLMCTQKVLKLDRWSFSGGG